MSADPMNLVRAIRRMERAGFSIRIDDSDLVVAPFSRLTTPQRDYLRTHKGELVQLLTDAETLAGLLEQAGSAGLSWKEGTPPEWDDGYLLALGEVLYGSKRMVNRLGRCYAAAVAPPLPNYGKALNVSEIAPQAETKALSEASA